MDKKSIKDGIYGIFNEQSPWGGPWIEDKLSAFEKYQNGVELTLHPNLLSETLKRKKTHNYLVCSIRDILNEKVPFDFIDRTTSVINQTPQHRY